MKKFLPILLLSLCLNAGCPHRSSCQTYFASVPVQTTVQPHWFRPATRTTTYAPVATAAPTTYTAPMERIVEAPQPVTYIVYEQPAPITYSAPVTYSAPQMYAPAPCSYCPSGACASGMCSSYGCPSGACYGGSCPTCSGGSCSTCSGGSCSSCGGW